MTLPIFEKFLFPFLDLLKDKKVHVSSEMHDYIAKYLELTEEDLAERIPSGYITRFKDRVKWARTYLMKAGLVESSGHGKYQITDEGLKVLKTSPNQLTMESLRKYPNFLEFQNLSPSQVEPAVPVIQSESTPEELIEQKHRELRMNLAQDLLEKVKQATPAFFEGLVVDLLIAMGYGGSRYDAGKAIGKSHDGGLDGIIKEDKLGLDVIFIQAKKWENTVGRPEVQAFIGSLEGARAKKGIMITTSKFSKEAEGYIEKIEKRIVLIDGEKLTQLMIDHGIGVTTVQTYLIQKIDMDFFNEE